MQAAIGYLRVSTQEQGRSGLGLAAQRNEIKAFGGAGGVRRQVLVSGCADGGRSSFLRLAFLFSEDSKKPHGQRHAYPHPSRHDKGRNFPRQHWIELCAL